MSQLQSAVDKSGHIERRGPYPQFILFGDSITQQSCNQENGFNFMPALQNNLVRVLDVINRGFSGYNTAQAKLVLPQFMPTPIQANVEFMTIFFGANDACHKGSQSGQHVPLPEYVENLREMALDPMVRLHNPHLIFITPPPVNEYQLNSPDAVRTAEVTRQYAEACREVGESLGVPVLDLWSSILKAAGWKEGEEVLGSRNVPSSPKLAAMFSDGLHLLSPGYEILYEALVELLNRQWPKWQPERSDFIFPVWTEAPI